MRSMVTALYLKLLLSTALTGSLILPCIRAEESIPSDRPPQYVFEDIVIPGASANEPTRVIYSFDAALNYLEQGAAAWSKKKKCVSCHTNGSYGLVRPALSVVAGKPEQEMRDFFVSQLRAMERKDLAELRKGLKPTQIAYIAAGLAEWDKHLTEQCSPETDAALKLMFSVQSEDGSYSNLDCWPPLESSDYHGATIAVMAAAAAPGWITENKTQPELAEKLRAVKEYLRKATPPHQYAQVLLLRTAATNPGLLDSPRRESILAMIWKNQNEDGAWSLRDFATPETWGDGSRAEKLRAEPDFDNPQSDGHMTGLALLALLESGVPRADDRIAKAVAWLKRNQRASGRWWTRSLNTDKSHFITYSGTCYPLLALAKCESTR